MFIVLAGRYVSFTPISVRNMPYETHKKDQIVLKQENSMKYEYVGWNCGERNL